MKTKLTCLALVLIALPTMVFAQQAPVLSTSNSANHKSKIQVLVPMKRWPSQPSPVINRTGNASSRPWVKIVAAQPADQDSFMDAENMEPHFDLVSLRSTPKK